MAKVDSDVDISGRYGNLLIYKIRDKLYARTKSSLDRNRFFKDPAFARSREKAKAFGRAAALAKVIYATLPKEIRKHGLFGKLTALVQKGYQEGKTKDELTKELQRHYCILPAIKSTNIVKPVAKVVKAQPALSNWKVTVVGLLQTNYLQARIPGNLKEKVVPLLLDG